MYFHTLLLHRRSRRCADLQFVRRRLRSLGGCRGDDGRIVLSREATCSRRDRSAAAVAAAKPFHGAARVSLFYAALEIDIRGAYCLRPPLSVALSGVLLPVPGLVFNSLVSTSGLRIGLRCKIYERAV